MSSSLKNGGGSQSRTDFHSFAGWPMTVLACHHLLKFSKFPKFNTAIDISQFAKFSQYVNQITKGHQQTQTKALNNIHKAN